MIKILVGGDTVYLFDEGDERIHMQEMVCTGANLDVDHFKATPEQWEQARATLDNDTEIVDCRRPIKRFQPRYVSYALAHGETDPAMMLDRDKADSPHGCMVRFINWNTAEWAAWNKAHPEIERTDPVSEEFTAWQRARARATFDALQGTTPE